MTHTQLSAQLANRATPAASAADRLILVFSVAFLVFMVLPSFLSAPFAPFPLMKVEDPFTLLTPLVLIPLYWLMLRQATGDRISPTVMLVFLLLTVLWVDGHGIKLAANSIGRLFNEEGPDAVARLTYFYDEVAGHYVWHIGLAGLSVLLVAAEWRNPASGAAISLPALGLAGLIYGLTFFMIVIEGQTAPLGVPFSALFALFGVANGRGHLASRPLLTFFLASYVIALVLFAIWGIYWRGLPEFSEVGIIK